VPSGASAGPADIARRYETVTRWEDLERWLAAVRAAELFAFDTETTSLDYMQAEIVGVSLCVEPGVAAYVPLRHVYPGAPDQLRSRARARGAQAHPRGSRARQGRHNLKYDAHVLANAGITLAGMRFDSNARVLRMEQRRNQSRPGLGRPALSRPHHHQLRGRRRQRRENSSASTRCRWSAPASMRPKMRT